MTPAFPVPDPMHRVTVEVLNGTTRNNLARDAARQLRQAGLDVVYFGGADSAVRTSAVLDRRGHPDAAHRVADALGLRVVITAPDPRRRVDVSVQLGADFVLARGHP